MKFSYILKTTMQKLNQLVHVFNNYCTLLCKMHINLPEVQVQCSIVYINIRLYTLISEVRYIGFSRLVYRLFIMYARATELSARVIHHRYLNTLNIKRQNITIAISVISQFRGKISTAI